MRRIVAVAYSGGRDSTALLHATLAAAEALGLEVVALHVHHGLSRHADAWQAACEAQCRAWAEQGRPVRCVATRIESAPPAGESIEAWARRERYAALTRMARDAGADVVLLAQHRRDQAETFLLQALRGAGPAGLASMPAASLRDGIWWRRPWLGQPREAIETYLERHGLAAVDDDSNADRRHARNRLRLDVWPALRGGFADAESALAAAAQRAQEAAAALAELAALDLEALTTAQGLDVAAWLALSAPRRGNALRAWVKRELGRSASASLATRLATELAACTTARWKVEGGELRLHRGRLRWQPLPVTPLASAGPRDARASPAATESPVVAPETQLAIAAPGLYRLPGWRGSFEVTPVDRDGIALERLARLELRPRRGGERFRAGPGRPGRSLKKQYQAAGVPAWQRDGPLVYVEGRLAWVPGLGIEAGMLDAAASRQVALSWLPD